MISKNRKRIKNIVFYILVFFLVIVVAYFTIWKNYLSDIVMYGINGKQEKDIVETIEINNLEVPYDKNSKTFYYPINAEDEGKDIKFDIEITSKNKVRYIIKDQEFDKKATITTTVDFNNPIEIYSSNNYIYNKYYIKFTNIPIINISNKSSDVKTEYLYGEVNVVDPNYIQNESEYCLTSKMRIRTRGSSSSYYEKKSYRIKLCEDNSNNKKDLSLLGMRTDSDWILDSLYTDNSKIRNGMSSDIWNLINEDVDEGYHVKLNWKFVEVFMYDEYVGLYVLKEPVDEKSLNLNKTSNGNSGILLKGIDNYMPDFSEERIKSLNGDVYYGLEIKYPEDLKDNSLYWYKILSKMKNYYSGNITDEVIEDTFYLENLVNYRLFITAINAVDNYEPKNVYFSLKDFNEDTKLLLTPWDLDLTFGLGWDNEIGAKDSYEQFGIVREINIGNSPNYVKKIKQRWSYLRENVFNETIIINLTDRYYKELTLSDAIIRDYNRWKNSDIDVEFKNIKEWCNKRFEVVDRYISEL